MRINEKCYVAASSLLKAKFHFVMGMMVWYGMIHGRKVKIARHMR